MWLGGALAPLASGALSWSCDSTAANSCDAPLVLEHTWSQRREDVFLAKTFFCDKCITTQHNYVEIGALDGLRFSNTVLLERQLNWRGLLIEGHPINAARLVQNRGASGRNFIINEAVCDPAGALTFTGVGRAVGGVQQTMSKVHQQHHIDALTRNHTVPCRPFGEMLRLAGALRRHTTLAWVSQICCCRSRFEWLTFASSRRAGRGAPAQPRR